MVLGELACGTPPARSRTLADPARLRPCLHASPRAVLAFLEREQLFGLGCGWVVMNLPASILITPDAALWALDRRLADLAARLGAVHRAPA